MSLVEAYAGRARSHAVAREVDPDVWVATVAGLDGVLADADTETEALDAIPAVVIGWVEIKHRIGGYIPPLDGLDLNAPE